MSLTAAVESLNHQDLKEYILNKTLSTILFLSFICTGFVFSGTSFTYNESAESLRSIFDRLSDEDILKISIRTDVDRLIEDKYKGKYQVAYMQFTDSSGSDKEWRVDIKARGKLRKKICDFPPVKIKFNHEILGAENLLSFKSLKLVTHCGDEKEMEELVLKEFLAYKMYNLLTDRSLRVQLVKIDWVDAKGNHQIGEKWAFLIENEDELAHRLNGGVYDQFGVQQGDLNTQSAAHNSLFQYMIGNADWNLQMNKNICLIKPFTSSDIMVIPYDFDFSGIVNAPHAVAEHGLTSIQERIYLGECSEKDLNEARQLFLSKKDDILTLISSFNHLSRGTRKDVKKYVQSFYSSLDEPFRDVTYYKERRDSNKVRKKADNSDPNK